jgi:hypothetical protein
MKSTLLENFQNVLGQPNLIPLFEPNHGIHSDPASGYEAARGTGSNAEYHVVGFVGVKVSHAEGNGNNMDISVQPTAVVDPNLYMPKTNIKPAGPPDANNPLGKITTTFISAKLTQ